MADGAFQKQVAYVAFIIFLILMALTALMMGKFKEHQLYPPEVPPCPDYWENLGDHKCKNSKDLGNGKCKGEHSFKAKEWQGVAGRKKKCGWAKSCLIEWDGISNVKGNC